MPYEFYNDSIKEEIVKLEMQVRQALGNFDLKDRHTHNAVRRKVLFTYLYKHMTLPIHYRVLAIAKHYGFTIPAIRYILKITVSKMGTLLKTLPQAEGLIFTDRVNWYVGSVHKLESADWYKHNAPRVAKADDYDIAYIDDRYVYSPRPGSDLTERMRLCGMSVVVTDIKKVDEEIVGVYIAQDGGSRMYYLAEFQN